VITVCLAECILKVVRGDTQDRKGWTSAKRLELKWTSSQIEFLGWITTLGGWWQVSIFERQLYQVVLRYSYDFASAWSTCLASVFTNQELIVRHDW